MFFFKKIGARSRKFSGEEHVSHGEKKNLLLYSTIYPIIDEFSSALLCPIYIMLTQDPYFF
jgi:hypothetical protein